MCWEWDICGDLDDPHKKTATEEEVDRAFLDWFGGWGSMGSSMSITTYDDPLEVLDEHPQKRDDTIYDYFFGP
jgi:hypothetical protein